MPLPDSSAASAISSVLASTKFGAAAADDGAVPSTDAEAVSRLGGLADELARPSVETALSVLSAFNATGHTSNPTSETGDSLGPAAAAKMERFASELGSTLSSALDGLAPASRSGDWSVRALWSAWTAQHRDPAGSRAAIESAAADIVSTAFRSAELDAHKFAPGLTEAEAVSRVSGALDRVAQLLRYRVDQWVAAHPSRWSEQSEGIASVVAEELGDIATLDEDYLWRDKLDGGGSSRVSLVRATRSRPQSTSTRTGPIVDEIDRSEREDEGRVEDVSLVVTDTSPVGTAHGPVSRVFALARRDTENRLVVTTGDTSAEDVSIDVSPPGSSGTHTEMTVDKLNGEPETIVSIGRSDGERSVAVATAA